MRRFGGQRAPSKVFLNVYDLHESNDYLYTWGLGSFHSGVEIDGVEYTFGGSGVFTHEPRNVPNAKFREAVFMGDYDPSRRSIDSVLDEVKHDFRDHSYNIIFKNCNHFSEAFIRILLGKDIPAYVNRLAYIGSYFSCFFPDSMVNQAPVNEPGYSGSVRASASRSGAAGGSNAHAFTASKGHRLQEGVASTADAENEPLMDRKERIRQAALRRFQSPNSSNASSSNSSSSSSATTTTISDGGAQLNPLNRG